jgi:hypothetical protein
VAWTKGRLLVVVEGGPTTYTPLHLAAASAEGGGLYQGAPAGVCRVMMGSAGADTTASGGAATMAMAAAGGMGVAVEGGDQGVVLEGGQGAALDLLQL